MYLQSKFWTVSTPKSDRSVRFHISRNRFRKLPLPLPTKSDNILCARLWRLGNGCILNLLVDCWYVGHGVNTHVNIYVYIYIYAHIYRYMCIHTCLRVADSVNGPPPLIMKYTMQRVFFMPGAPGAYRPTGRYSAGVQFWRFLLTSAFQLLWREYCLESSQWIVRKLSKTWKNNSWESWDVELRSFILDFQETIKKYPLFSPTEWCHVVTGL